MRHMLAAAAFFIAGAASATEAPKMPPMQGSAPPAGMTAPNQGGNMTTPGPRTRQDAIAMLKKRLAELEKMSDQEWANIHNQRRDRLEQLRGMTPEDREKFRKEMLERRARMGASQSPAAGSAPVAPAAPATVPAAKQ